MAAGINIGRVGASTNTVAKIRSMKRTQVLSLAAIGVAGGLLAKPAPIHAATTYSWTNGDTTSLWNSSSTTLAWRNATAFPNAAGVIAEGPTASGNNGTANLNLNVTVGELKPGSTSGGAGWSVVGTANTITMDATGLGTNDFGDTNAEIRDASSAGSFAINTNLLMLNTSLDIGWVNTNDTVAMTIGTLGTTTLNNAGSTGNATTALALNIESGSKGGGALPSTIINSAIGTSGAPISISDSTTGGGAVEIMGAIGSSVTTVTNSGVTRLMLSNTGNAYTGDTTVASGAILNMSFSYGSDNVGQVLPYGVGKGNLVVNGTLELAGNSEQVNALNGTSTTGVIQSTSWDGAVGGGTAVLTFGNNNTSGSFPGKFSQTTAGRFLDYTKVGSGTEIMNGSGSVLAAITVSGGTLQIGDGTETTAVLGNVFAGTPTPVTDNANVAFNYNGAVNVANAITGSGTVSQIGSAALTLSGASSFSGGLNISSSSVITGSSNTGTIGTGTVTMAAGTTLDMAGFSPTIGQLSSTAASAVVTNSGASNAVLTLSGTATTTFAGVIQDGPTNTNSIVKGGAGTQVLSGLNTYSGSTTITAGKLQLAPSATLGNTAITVSPAATFGPQAGSGSNSAGTTGAGSLGATLNLLPGTGASPGGTFNMYDGAVGIFYLNQQASFSGTALTLGGGGSATNAPILTFDLGAHSADEMIVSTGSVSVGSTGADVTITPITGVTSITPGNYTIISAPGGGLSALTLTASSFVLGSQPYSLSLANSTSTAEILTVSVANNIPINAYWTGAGSSTSWGTTSPTNFATTNTGTTPTSGPPGGGTNVFMTADSANSATLSTTLDAAYNINSLTFTGTGTTAATTSVTVAPGNGGTLTLSPSNAFTSSGASGTTTYGPGIGIVVQAGSAAHTISAPVILASSQAWEIDNAPANGLTVSGGISDNNAGYVLNKTGTGTLILSGSDTYSGGTNISGGVLQTTAVGALPLNAPLTVNGGTLDMAGNSQTVSTLSDGGVATGAIINSGAAATFNINGSTGSTFSGSFNASASTLTVNGTGTVTLSGPNTLLYFNPYGTLANLAATGSINASGDVNVGDNGNFNVTGGSITTAAFYTGSKGTSATIIGPGSTVTVNGALAIDNDNGAGGASYLQNSGGVINVTSITIGRTGFNGGVGPVVAGPTNEGFYISSGTVNDAGTLYLGTNASTNSNADLRMDGGTFNVSGATLITDVGNTRASTIDINGGTFNATTVQIGGNIGTTLGQTGELLVRGTGIANVSGITFGNSAQVSGTNVLELLGGSLYVGAGGLVNNSTITPTVNLGGTAYTTDAVLAASAPWSSSVLITLTNTSAGLAPIIQTANVSGGAVNITLTGNLEGNGGLTKTGAGTLFLTNGNGYFGVTNINAGILNINGQFALGGADYGGASFNGGILQFATGSFPTNANGTGDITQNSTGTAETVLINAGGATIDTNGNPVNFANRLTGVGGLTVLDTSGSGGSLTLNGVNTYAGNTNVASGTLTVASTGSLASTTGLLVAGTVNLQNPTQVIASLSGTGLLNLTSSALQITAHSAAPLANTIGTLSLSGATGSWTSSLDLTNNALIIHSASIATITNQVAQGYNGGNWNGTGGILSSTAAANTSHLTAIGVIVNDDGTGLSHALYPTFENVASVDGDVLVKYTYYGDTDLNGKVDGTDYSRIDHAYAFNLTASSRLTGWFNGDFNYDGVINGSDYTLMDNAFNQQSTVFSAQVATATAVVGGSGSAVPEPTSLALLGIGAFGLLGRRNRAGKGIGRN